MRRRERRTTALVRIAAALALIATACASPAQEAVAQPPAWRDAAVPLEQRVNILLPQLTLDEQVQLLRGITTPAGEHAVGYVAGVPRLGIPPLRLTDGPAGVRDGLPATAMPAPVSMAATFDRALAAEAGDLVGREVKARGYQVLYSPMVNIVRIPQGGRNFETYGEDPHLAGQLAASYVAGVQRQRVAAQVKHVAANNQEDGRLFMSSAVDDRTLREIYLPAFETAVRQGGAWSAMCAYNQVNGAWACESFPLLNDIIRDRWGFDGAVGSDYPATHSGVRSALAGLDQEFGGSTHYAGLADAVRSGALARAALEENVRRVLRLMIRTGLLDGDPRPVVDPAAHAAVARRQAAAGTVLLKNDRSLLPLTPGTARTVAVSGWYADIAHTGGKGSSYVTPYPEHTVKPLDGLRARVGEGLTYTPGARPSPFPVPPDVFSDLRADYFANHDLAGAPVASAAHGSIDFDWALGAPAPNVPADHWSARWTGTLTVPVTGAYDLALTSDDGSRVYLDGNLVVDNWGDHDTQTRSAPITLQGGARHRVQVEYYDAAGKAGLRFGWFTPAAADPELQRAVDAARAADVAVVVVGDDSTEGADRPSIDLPGNQDELVAAITTANPDTVVVLETGGPVTMPWLPAAQTVVESWYPGEQGGHALADVLFGAAEPGGRLPVTFPTGLGATPISSPAQYPGAGGVYDYSERLRVGYRWYDATGTTPLFPFGHGLSYTTFRYGGLAVTSSGDEVTVSFDVTNTGGRAGSAVPQVYVGHPADAGEPPRQLRGFTKVGLAAGATTRVSVDLDRRSFAIWDPAERSFRVPPGSHTIAVGESSRDIRLTGAVDRQAERVPNGATGQVVNAGSCLDVADADDAAGTPVQLWSCNGTAAQRWTVTPEGTVRALGRCLAPSGDAVVLADCAGQRWTVADGGPLRSGDRCLDSSGGALRLAPCAGGAAQTWQPPRPADRVTGIAGKCVDVDGANTGNGTVVWLFDCNGTGAQDWKLDADGSLRALGKCMDVTNGWTDPGTPVQLWDCNGTAAQQWRAAPGGALVNIESGRCLDARNGFSDNFTRLQIWDCNGTAAQTWVLPRR
ncbi:glycoside hydrolase family 3 C-terminal domain-containing protein [Saccharothrix deserti]|uniref:glycoside hydrolase family 3 C-terminal domain-containing protein n=1 Tax=Saccharothrix deserti TaxID=2593674 RepID=UPI00131A9ACD|nr:glycoside hydrolase family 3 C-terminal domain-containing protein [Saccharothrix deserti]